MGIGLDNHRQGYECGRQAARAALASIGSEPVTLALLFTSHPQPEQVLKGVNEALGPVPLIGATSVGEYTHQGYVEEGAGVMLIQSDQIHFHPLVRQRNWFRRASLLGKLHGTSEEGLGSVYSHRALMLFPDDKSMNLNGVVDQAMTETALLYDILGGPGPTIPAPPRPPAVFHNRQMLRAGLAGAEVLSQQPLGLALANGWTPISGPYRVTQVDEHRLIKIEGRPTREIYEDFFRDQGVQSEGDNSPQQLLRYPIGLCQEGNCRVSVGMGFDQAGALQMTSPPPQHSLVHILSTRPDAMLTAAQRAIHQAILSLHGQPAAGLLFIDCMSTAMLLGSAHEQQRAAVQRELGDLPFLGFRSHGVLARLQGQLTGHYECSVATCALPG
jgi:hypothetical protein